MLHAYGVKKERTLLHNLWRCTLYEQKCLIICVLFPPSLNCPRDEPLIRGLFAGSSDSAPCLLSVSTWIWPPWSDYSMNFSALSEHLFNTFVFLNSARRNQDTPGSWKTPKLESAPHKLLKSGVLRARISGYNYEACGSEGSPYGFN